MQAPLPGQTAQLEMAAYHNRLNLRPSTDAADAAVLILLFPNIQGQISTLFIERIQHDQDQHSGQIAFPGGRTEPTDVDAIDCALREAHEEVNLAIEQVQVIGKLSPLYIPVSRYLVTPVVGLLPQDQHLRPQATEVASIIRKEILHFQDPSNRKKTSIRIRNGLTLQGVPYFDLDGRILWGATAMILNELLTLLGDFDQY